MSASGSFLTFSALKINVWKWQIGFGTMERLQQHQPLLQLLRNVIQACDMGCELPPYKASQEGPKVLPEQYACD